MRSAKPITSRMEPTTLKLNTSKTTAEPNRSTSTSHAHRRRRTSAASNTARIMAKITKPTTIPATVACLCGENKTLNSPTSNGSGASRRNANNAARVLPSSDSRQLKYRCLNVAMNRQSTRISHHKSAANITQIPAGVTEALFFGQDFTQVVPKSFTVIASEMFDSTETPQEILLSQFPFPSSFSITPRHRRDCRFHRRRKENPTAPPIAMLIISVAVVAADILASTAQHTMHTTALPIKSEYCRIVRFIRNDLINLLRCSPSQLVSQSPKPHLVERAYG